MSVTSSMISSHVSNTTEHDSTNPLHIAAMLHAITLNSVM